jgi:hypothetical protein
VTGVLLVVATSLAILALLAFAVSVVGFLIQTSRHRPTRAWSLAAGASLVLSTRQRLLTDVGANVEPRLAYCDRGFRVASSTRSRSVAP